MEPAGRQSSSEDSETFAGRGLLTEQIQYCLKPAAVQKLKALNPLYEKVLVCEI